MRRRRGVYYTVVAVIVAALGVGVGIAWSRGEVAHASLHTFAPAPPTVAIQSPSQTLHEAWHTADRTALGTPQWGGTIVTYSEHSVGGRDARTGARTWHYTRTDRTICSVAQLSGTTIAIYANSGNCDEVSAFASGTGARRWTRTLDMDGMPVNGQPTYQMTPYTLLVATPSVIYAVDPVTGYNRWTYGRYGCRIEHTALGSSGALISQNCSSQVRCSGVKFCGRGPQLLLRDGSAGEGDDTKPNADQIKWNKIGDSTVPVSADQVTTGVEPDGAHLDVLDPATGKLERRMPLTPDSPDLGSTAAIATAGAEVVWISDEAYAIRPDAAMPDWAASTSSPPTIASTVTEDTPALATARIAVPTGSGIGVLDGNDGRTIARFAVRPPGPGSLVYSLGTGFLVAGPSGTVAYR
jgi:hypothetical protein